MQSRFGPMAANFTSGVGPCAGIVEPFNHLLCVTTHPQILTLELQAPMHGCFPGTVWYMYVARTYTLQYSLLVKWQLVSLFLHSLPTLHRYKCGVPVIIEGETGVGKTALLEMLSKLWNHALVLEWKRQYRDLLDFMRLKLEDISTDVSDKYQVSQLACMHVFCAKELFSQKIGKMAHVLGVCSSIVFT